MNTIKITRLFDAARQAETPAVDVADAVLAALAVRRRSATAFQRSLMWMSMASSAAAAALALSAFWVWQHNTDAVNEMITMVSWAAQ